VRPPTEITVVDDRSAVLAARPWGAGPAAARPELRFSVQTLPLFTPSIAGCAALSPDGTKLVYVARDGAEGWRLYLRPLDAFEAVAIPGTEMAHSPFFSPDGRWVGYCKTTGGSAFLKRVPIDGGPLETIVGAPSVSASWGDDGTIVFTRNPGALWRVPASGGEPEAIGTPPDFAREVHSQPEVLPGSRRVLFTCWARAGGAITPRIEAMDLSTGERRVVVADASQPKFAAASGMLLFYRGGSLMGARFDAVRLALTGEPVHVIGPLSSDTVGNFAQYSVSRDGTLAIVPGNTPTAQTDLAWFGVDGASSTVFSGGVGIRTLRLSPDGARVAFTTEFPETDLWVLDLERGTPIRLMSEGESYFPVWTPDGSRLAFEHHEAGAPSRIVWMPADGSGEAELLYEHPGGATCFPTDFSPDGRTMLITIDVGPGDWSDVYLVALDADRAATLLHSTRGDRVAARFSPDGSMVAYCSTETGRPEIYVVPYPGVDQKVLVSTEGGMRPTWSADGARLFYRYADTMYAAEISLPPAMEAGLPSVVLEDLPGDRYDTAPDGARFIMARPRGDWGPQTEIEVVVGALSRVVK